MPRLQWNSESAFDACLDATRLFERECLVGIDCSGSTSSLCTMLRLPVVSLLCCGRAACVHVHETMMLDRMETTGCSQKASREDLAAVTAVLPAGLRG